MAKDSPTKRARQKSRLTEGRFLRLVAMVTDSDQWKRLSGNAVKVFMILLEKYRGNNNGCLAIPRGEMAKYGFGLNGRTVRNALKELMQAGFIVETLHGGCVPGASLYAITTEPIDASSKHDWPEQRTPMHTWRKIGRTKIVQTVEPKQFTQARIDPKSNEPCTIVVPIGKKKPVLPEPK